VYLRAGLDDLEKILDSSGTRTPTPGRAARSQFLYRLSYRGASVPRCSHLNVPQQEPARTLRMEMTSTYGRQV
jgi:hypothetical protein